ncbi:14749_t:CDS:2 [Entrophospora sp. SA101]|nr:9_t:CDS:2 [Entrophospora sp. SA101]CAJ0645229.1 14749_t:CDS:2 [Entrophospora sp. SA101]
MDELFVVEAYKWRIRGLSTMTLTDSVSVEQTTKSDPTEVFDIDSQDSYRGDGECEKPYWDDAIDEYIRCSNNDTFKTTCSKYKLICTIDQENHYAAQRKNFVRFALYRVEDSELFFFSTPNHKDLTPCFHINMNVQSLKLQYIKIQVSITDFIQS